MFDNDNDDGNDNNYNNNNYIVEGKLVGYHY